MTRGKKGMGLIDGQLLPLAWCLEAMGMSIAVEGEKSYKSICFTLACYQ